MVGVTSAPVSVLVPNAPFDTLTITPVPYSPHVVFNPSSITLNRTSFVRISTFTVTVNHPNVVGTVKFLITGLDAVYYSTPALSIVSVQPSMFFF